MVRKLIVNLGEEKILEEMIIFDEVTLEYSKQIYTRNRFLKYYKLFFSSLFVWFINGLLIQINFFIIL